jgi:hypothetical protein
MKKEILHIQKKKKKVSNALEANRARDSLARLDGRQCQSPPLKIDVIFSSHSHLFHPYSIKTS